MLRKTPASFRLDQLAQERLKELATITGLSQADFIEQMVSAAYNCYFHDWDVSEFKHFARTMKDRSGIYLTR